MDQHMMTDLSKCVEIKEKNWSASGYLHDVKGGFLQSKRYKVK